jgi:gliding motility-associated-like protein
MIKFIIKIANKKKQTFRYFIVLMLLVSNFSLINAQENDNCETALLLSNPSSFCSGPDGFTLVNTTFSSLKAPDCWNGQARDMWFKFKAVATSVDVYMVGGVGTGKLERGILAIYSGQCNGSLTNIQCNKDERIGPFYTTQISATLKVGEEYFIRVAGRNNTVGKFQLCLTNYNPPMSPKQDCNIGSILCDKSSFSVIPVEGGGAVETEANGTCLEPLFTGISESNSNWYKWTAADSGTLTFDIVPLRSSEDLDFALFEIRDMNTCTDKRLLRCVSNECSGSTGIKLGENEETEDGKVNSCGPNDNGYVKSISQVPGQQYALVVNQFGINNVGFKINFGGTGTFVGPQPDFTVVSEPNCGSRVKINYTGQVKTGLKFKWDFGANANIQTANTIGPFEINYSEQSGDRFITLTVELSSGCLVTKTQRITLGPCCVNGSGLQIIPTVVPPKCNNDKNASIELALIGGTAPFQIKLNDGPLSDSTKYRNLAPGTYKVQVYDNNGCRDSLNINIPNPTPIIVDAGPDKNITLGTSTPLSATYTPQNIGDSYLWSPSSNIINPNLLSTITSVDTTTTFTITVRNNKGCTGVGTVTLFAACSPQLLPKIKPTITRPNCNGENTGAIELNITEGASPYQIKLNNGAFSSKIKYSELFAGTYKVVVIDKKGCSDSLSVTVPDTALIVVDAGPDKYIIEGNKTSLEATYKPVSQGDTYLWFPAGFGKGGIESRTSLITNVTVDTVTKYYIQVRNRRGCFGLDSITIFKSCKPELSPKVVANVRPPACAGASTAKIDLVGTGGSGKLTYSIGNASYVDSTVFQNIKAGRYKVRVRDSIGCRDSIFVTITDPPGLSINAGEDQVISAGVLVNLTGSYSPENPTDSIFWSPQQLVDNPNSLTTSVKPTGTSIFILSIKNNQGCIYSDSLVIKSTESFDFAIANIFKPQSSLNGIFNVSTNAAKLVESLDIYNRWGSKVYHGKALDPNDPDDGWDGTFNGELLPTDVYVWIARVKLQDGTTKMIKGEITLIR